MEDPFCPEGLLLGRRAWWLVPHNVRLLVGPQTLGIPNTSSSWGGIHKELPSHQASGKAGITGYPPGAGRQHNGGTCESFLSLTQQDGERAGRSTPSCTELWT